MNSLQTNFEGLIQNNMFPFFSQSEIIYRITRRNTKIVMEMYKLHDEPQNPYDMQASLIY